jgi:hypothetical protein
MRKCVAGTTYYRNISINSCKEEAKYLLSHMPPVGHLKDTRLKECQTLCTQSFLPIESMLLPSRAQSAASSWHTHSESTQMYLRPKPYVMIIASWNVLVRSRHGMCYSNSAKFAFVVWMNVTLPQR